MANENSAPVTTTLFFRRMHPGGGPLGRCSYGIPGVPGIVVFDVGMFLGGICPATIVLPLAMAAPAARKVAAVTSAVVAAANTTVAVESGTAIATPPAVAAVVAEGAAVVVAAASNPSAKPAKDKGRLVRGHKAQVA